jgi:hypothetical protein
VTLPTLEPIVPTKDRRNLSSGVALIGVGLYMLLSRYFGLRGAGPILILLGALFFVLSATRRFRGPLLPAGVLLGLGAGMMLRVPLEPWMPHWSTILLGLGAGFLLVASIDHAASRRRQPPAIVPGAVLTGVALAEFAARSLSLDIPFTSFEPLWPFLVLAAGLLLVISAFRRRKT